MCVANLLRFATSVCGQQSNKREPFSKGGGNLMSRRLLSFAGAVALVFAAAGAAFAQDQQPTTVVTTQTTQAVQNPDGTWSVIQYPTGKEVVIDFAPGPPFTTAHGRAKIIHMADGTKIALDLSGLPAD